METVKFVHMAEGTAEDYALLGRYEADYIRQLPDRLLLALEGLRHSLAGYQITRYEHSLQSATRALLDSHAEEYVVAALLHDIGDELAPYSHGEMVAAILKPFVSPEICWIIKYHGLFQMYYYAHYSGGNRDARDLYAGHPYYEACAEFCALYDQNCFDPAFETLPISVFEPMVRRVFARPRYLAEAAEETSVAPKENLT